MTQKQWEFVRTRTVKRMLNRVDIVVGGSCWWTLTEVRIPGYKSELREIVLEMMIETPGRFARMLGVPVVHAAHAGDFEGETPLMPDIPYKSYYLGETQIVDGNGKILAEAIPNRFWIPDMPQELIQAWEVFNKHRETYYQEKTKPYIFK